MGFVILSQFSNTIAMQVAVLLANLAHQLPTTRLSDKLYRLATLAHRRAILRFSSCCACQFETEVDRRTVLRSEGKGDTFESCRVRHLSGLF